MPYLVEETFELVDALAALDPDDPATEHALVEELGDLLYQVEFHATIAEQAGRFSIADVTNGIHDKLVGRHPHVFGDVAAPDADTVIANWDDIKRAEKGRTSVFDGVAASLPALAYAHHLQRKAAKVGFDWPDVAGPYAKIDEELAELRRAVETAESMSTSPASSATCCSPSSTSPGTSASTPSSPCARQRRKFRRRFEAVENARRRAGHRRWPPPASTTLDALWDEVKAARPTEFRDVGPTDERAGAVRLQLADPADHPHVGSLPFATDLADWDLPHMRGVLGLHRHEVRLVELGDGPRRTSYVVKELPDHLALREYRLLRSLAADRLPTVQVVAVVTDRTDERNGLLVTRHLDYSLPYRNLLAGQGLTIPYLGDRLLDALVGLLVRLHLAGFFWGDCSLSNIAVPPRRRRADGVHHRRRDERTVRTTLPGAAGPRPGDRHRERGRRAPRPASRADGSSPASTRGRSPRTSSRRTTTSGPS